MSDRARVLKAISIISSSLILFALSITIIFSIIDEFAIYPYIFLGISSISCSSLWKMYIDEKKRNIN